MARHYTPLFTVLMPLGKSLQAVLLLCAFLAPQQAVALTPERLRCEYLVNPLGIDEPLPRLSWIVTSRAQGASQTAYQILTASSSDLLSQDRGDVWDSGKVLSDKTSPIEYHGRCLKSGEAVWWKVRVWDQDGEVSGWSLPSTWEMGLLDAADWNAKWIARSAEIGKQPLPLLRRGFRIDAPVKRARLYVTGLGYYEVSINGGRIGQRLLDPGFTRYDRRVLYSTYDVTENLRQGENAIGVMLGNGWFNVNTVAPWGFDSAVWRASPRVILRLSVELEDGTTYSVVSNKDWKATDGPILYSSIYGGETYDARLEIPDWNRPGFDANEWVDAVVVDAPGGTMVAQSMPPIMATKILKPVKVTEPKPGVYLFDLGQNLAGVAELRLSGSAGQEVHLKYGEKLREDGLVDQSNIGVHVWKAGAHQRFQEDVYITKGGATEAWRPRFVYHGFRYVEVSGAEVPLSADNLSVHFVHSAVSETGHFHCSNPILNRTWENARWSYLSNLHGVPTDCPHREKNGWTADAHLACEMGLWSYDGIRIYEKWLDDLADEQQPKGALPGIVPTAGWGYKWGNGPAWDSALLLVPEYMRLYYGDARSSRRLYDHQRKYVDYLSERSGNAVNALGLGDWSPAKTRTPVGVTSTAYHYQDALLVSRTAAILGKPEEAAHYGSTAAAIKKAFNKRFYDPATGNYSIGSQTAQSCALFMGLTEPKSKAPVIRALLDRVASDEDHIDTGVLGAKYLLHALTKAGHAEVAYRIASQRTQPGWGWWVDQNATTLWENWGGDGSRNHAFFGDCVNWYFRALAGINPDSAAPGFKHIIIRPEPVGDLTSVAADFDSVRGMIKSEWRLRENQFELTVEIPANATATVYLPTSDAKAIQVDGRPLAQCCHTECLSVRSGRARIRLMSGRYRFSTPLR